MKTNCRHGIAGLAMLLALVLPRQVSAVSEAANALWSRMESMRHGYYSRAEWESVLSELDALSQQALSTSNWQDWVELSIQQAMIVDDALKDEDKALSILREARARCQGMPLPNLSKVYVREAEIDARRGNSGAVADLIRAFKSSPAYDREAYAFTGGQGRDVPLAVTRPSAGGDTSITVTMLETHRRQAQAVGAGTFPDFEMRDLDGQTVRLSDFRGRVVLIDFWMRGWAPWQRSLPGMTALYRRYHEAGFDILGVSLERRPEALEAFLRETGIPWPQVTGDDALARRLGIFGEATNFLLDGEGRILGRNLRDADLTAVVKRALRLE